MKETEPYQPREQEIPQQDEGIRAEDEGNPAEDCTSVEAREITGEDPETPTDTDFDTVPVIEKTEEELLEERLERQDVADEQAESIRQAEEAHQQELAKQGTEPVV